MPLQNKDIAETIRRLRRHPVFCMDGQNITADAADELERLYAKIHDIDKTMMERLPDLATVLLSELVKSIPSVNSTEKESK